MLNRPPNGPSALAASASFPGHRLSPVRRRIVVVGLGSIGRRHARLLAMRPDVTVEICDPAPEALAKARADLGDVAVHADFAAVLRSRPHAVVIATPHDLHAKQATAAMQAGVDVLCEKPLCMTGDEARTIIARTRQTGRTLAVGFQLHFHPGLLRVRELIEAGVIGKVAHLHVRVGSFITLRNSASRYQHSLRGALLLDYSHQPDLIIWLLGELPAGVTLTGLKAGGMPLTSEPNVMAMTLDYDRPLLATVHLNYLQMPQRHEWEIVGDKGWLLLDADRGTLRIGLRESETERLETIAADRDEAYRREHQAFMDCLDGQRDPESAGLAAARTVELFEMAMTSLAEGRRVVCQWRGFE